MKNLLLIVLFSTLTSNFLGAFLAVSSSKSDLIEEESFQRKPSSLFSRDENKSDSRATSFYQQNPCCDFAADESIVSFISSCLEKIDVSQYETPDEFLEKLLVDHPEIYESRHMSKEKIKTYLLKYLSLVSFIDEKSLD